MVGVASGAGGFGAGTELVCASASAGATAAAARKMQKKRNIVSGVFDRTDDALFKQ
jgi:hypothetical protein